MKTLSHGRVWIAAGVWLAWTLAMPSVAHGQRSEPLIDGDEVAKRVENVTRKISWHRDLEEALAAAKATGKPLFWLQLVGDLDDGL